jgi:hypothetical protein
MTVENGDNVEELVANLCANSFFADFTFPSPKYRKLDGQEKEAADILIAFQATLLVIQVKSRKVDLSREDQKVDEKRFTAKVNEGVKQFRAIAEAFNRPDFTSLKNARGIEVRFEKKPITNIILLLVAAPMWSGNTDRPTALRFDKTMLSNEEAPIPLHLFTLDQFRLLTTLADTLPDFLHFLECRWAMHSMKLIPPDSDPFDEWMLVTFQGCDLSKAILEREPLQIEGLQELHTKSLAQLEQEEQVSYLIDWLVESLNESIGKDFPVDNRLRLLQSPNSIETYRIIIPLLARLSRAERRELANLYCVRHFRCRHEGQDLSFGGIIFPKFDEGYLVVVTTGNVQKVQAASHNISRAFCYKHRLKSVICIFGCEANEIDLPIGATWVDASNDDGKGLGGDELFSEAIERNY